MVRERGRATWVRRHAKERMMINEDRRSKVAAALRAPRRGRARACTGFTLIEVLVAAMLLAIGLVGVSSMVYYGVLSHQKSANYTIAAQKAMQEIERIRDGGYLGATVEPTRFPSPTYQIVDSSTVRFGVAELSAGQGAITVAEDSEAMATNPNTGQPYLNMKQVNVSITWGGSSKSSGSYSLATLISNRP